MFIFGEILNGLGFIVNAIVTVLMWIIVVHAHQVRALSGFIST